MTYLNISLNFDEADSFILSVRPASVRQQVRKGDVHLLDGHALLKQQKRAISKRLSFHTLASLQVEQALLKSWHDGKIMTRWCASTTTTTRSSYYVKRGVGGGGGTLSTSTQMCWLELYSLWTLRSARRLKSTRSRIGSSYEEEASSRCSMDTLFFLHERPQ